MGRRRWCNDGCKIVIDFLGKASSPPALLQDSPRGVHLAVMSVSTPERRLIIRLPAETYDSESEMEFSDYSEASESEIVAETDAEESEESGESVSSSCSSCSSSSYCEFSESESETEWFSE